MTWNWRFDKPVLSGADGLTMSSMETPAHPELVEGWRKRLFETSASEKSGLNGNSSCVGNGGAGVIAWTPYFPKWLESRVGPQAGQAFEPPSHALA